MRVCYDFDKLEKQPEINNRSLIRTNINLLSSENISPAAERLILLRDLQKFTGKPCWWYSQEDDVEIARNSCII